MKFLERLFGGKKPEVPSEKQSHSGVAVAVNLRLHIAKRIQDGNPYTQVEIFNCNCPEYGWRGISPKFYQHHTDENIESLANRFLRGVLLQGDELIAVRRIVFLECLQRHCEREHCSWFFWYVLSMVKYFSSCYVKDESKIEICVDHQLADEGDEFFDMAYSVCEELRLGEVSEAFSMKMLDATASAESRGMDNGAPNGHERFLHIGSDTKDLMRIHWTIDLDKIKVTNMIRFCD